MLGTALESGDYLLRAVLPGIYHVRVNVPAGIDTLDFGLTRDQTEALFTQGMADTHSFFARAVPQWAQAQTNVELLQALTGVPPRLVVPVLAAMAGDFTGNTGAKHVRANVMLPTPRQTRMVVYHYGMENDPDVDLELDTNAGCSGRAWTKRCPVVADLIDAKGKFDREWGMTRAQQNRVREDRAAMFSFPMFDLSTHLAAGATSADDLRLLGIASVDTNTPLEDTGWVGARRDVAIEIGKKWADILSRLLT
jgi:hypothetical protein